MSLWGGRAKLEAGSAEPSQLEGRWGLLWEEISEKICTKDGPVWLPFFLKREELVWLFESDDRAFMEVGFGVGGFVRSLPCVRFCSSGREALEARRTPALEEVMVFRVVDERGGTEPIAL